MDKSCKYYSDKYDKDKEDNPNDKGTLDDDKREINRCIEKLLIFVRLNYKIGKISKNLKYNCLLIF